MTASERLVLASGNRGKVRELQQILSVYSIDVVPQSELGVEPCDETGLSFVENAILKAQNAARHTGLPAIADDSGILVDALGGAPGVYSARYAGENASDAENLAKLLDDFAKQSSTVSSCRFVCLMVYVRTFDDPLPIICQGIWEGQIVAMPRGDNGFGYDPIFWLAEYKCTSAELPAEVKNKISHRAKALNQLVKFLPSIYRDDPAVPRGDSNDH